jgi:hypothetical protein
VNDLSLHILDILQNSLAAGARLIELTVDFQPGAHRLTIIIKDDGRGMDPQQVARLADPFFTSRTTRRVGMGVPLYIQSARQAGGDVRITSTPGHGTSVEAWFDTGNVDIPPMGDLPGAVVMTGAANPDVEFVFTYVNGPDSYVFDTQQVREALGGLPLADPGVRRAVTEMIENNIRAIKT